MLYIVTVDVVGVLVVVAGDITKTESAKEREREIEREREMLKQHDRCRFFF
jgi:hypothetical protein